MPNRGLDVALAIWSKIHKAVPEAELWITSGWKLWGYTNSEADDRWKQIIGDQPLPQGVKLYGTVSRQRLITLQQRGWLTLYPSRFPEMFCLTAAESAAAGTPVITSARDALIERIAHDRTGILIDGPIECPMVQQRFANETVNLLTDPARRDQLAHQAHLDAQDCDSDRIAQAWEELATNRSRALTTQCRAGPSDRCPSDA